MLILLETMDKLKGVSLEERFLVEWAEK